MTDLHTDNNADLDLSSLCDRVGIAATILIASTQRLSSGLSQRSLAPIEHERANMICSDRDRQQWIARRLTLRMVLGSLLHCHPADVMLEYTGTGKPRLASTHGTMDDLFFNLAGRGDVMAMVISQTREVGIDLETIRARLAEEIGRFAFATSERKSIAISTNPDFEATRLWCRKEAFVKAVGTGLTIDPGSINVNADVVQVKENRRNWALVDLPTLTDSQLCAACFSVDSGASDSWQFVQHARTKTILTGFISTDSDRDQEANLKPLPCRRC